MLVSLQFAQPRVSCSCSSTCLTTLVPEVFLEFSPRERAAKRRMRVAKRRERKTSGYLGPESHFHADAGVMI